ncbi:MAG: transcriptional regulator [Acidobacteriia bacterium]|nr:transcriptional regulator [Terriglobia bacterium]
MLLTGRHIRAARALLGWAQSDLARKAKVALRTVRRMEGFEGPVGARTDTVGKVATVLQKASIEFLNDGEPGVRLKKRG